MGACFVNLPFCAKLGDAKHRTLSSKTQERIEAKHNKPRATRQSFRIIALCSQQLRLGGSLPHDAPTLAECIAGLGSWIEVTHDKGRYHA